jgi:uncharacterized protein YcbX
MDPVTSNHPEDSEVPVSDAKPNSAGIVGALWRYPVKSMAGEKVASVFASASGVWGDRAYALVDAATGKLASAKNPRKWQLLFDCRARFVRAPEPAEPLPPASITLPDGGCVATDDAMAAARLSRALGREVTIACGGTEQPSLEEYWPDLESLAHRDEVTDELIMPNSFFDGAPIHLLTTATLAALATHYRTGYFDARRFRPNIVLDTGETGPPSFKENEWIGRTLAIGPEVLLKIERVTGRCVMTTLAQGELPRDLGILRTAAHHNSANVGVYATVLRGGAIHEGDSAHLV